MLREQTMCAQQLFSSVTIGDILHLITLANILDVQIRTELSTSQNSCILTQISTSGEGRGFFCSKMGHLSVHRTLIALSLVHHKGMAVFMDSLLGLSTLVNTAANATKVKISTSGEGRGFFCSKMGHLSVHRTLIALSLVHHKRMAVFVDSLLGLSALVNTAANATKVKVQEVLG
ncbi:hypothetical protein RRG08_020597 [Elysia crispata]|uniref:Uncharacterized protein n=1 Tax=Elysia crispata TaxID=231223 RepID=A0AAE1DSX8_9GAST|nr:hypothetical protein RRG08_020597 [Elysia crispata]